MSPEDFGSWFRSQLQHLGLETFSNEEVRGRLGVSVTAETLRKLRGKSKYKTRSSTMKELEEAIHRATNASTISADEEHVLDSVYKTCRWSQAIKSILRSPNFFVQDGHKPCDVMQVKMDSPFSFVYRVLDFSLTRDKVGDLGGILCTAIRDMSNTYQERHQYNYILTDAHIMPSVAELARKLGVGIQPLQTSLRQLFPIDKLRENVLDTRRILDTTDFYINFPVSILDTKSAVEQLSKAPLNDLLNLITLKDTPALVLVVGPYGTGKSSLIAETAFRLLKEYEASHGHGILPYHVRANELKWTNVELELSSAWSSGYVVSGLHHSVIFDLIRMNIMCLMIDGLDEQVNLRDRSVLEYQLREQLFPLFHNSASKVVVSVRSEVFMSPDEQRSFESQIESLFNSVTEGKGRFTIFRTDLLDETLIQNYILGRLGVARGRHALEFITKEPALLDLARRPIFIHMMACTDDSFSVGEKQWTVSDLFARYISQWCREEEKKVKPLLLSAEQREQWCVAAAEYIYDRGSVGNSGFTAPELISFVEDMLDQRDMSRSIGRFQNDARIAMFLKRSEELGGIDRFFFSHDSLYDYFLAKAIIRQFSLNGANRFRMLSGKLFDKADVVLPTFIREMLLKIKTSAADLDAELSDILFDLLSWGANGIVGREVRWSLATGEYSSPPFGPGLRKHLLSNVITLLSVGPHGVQTGVKLNLKNAHFGGEDISIISPIIIELSSLEGANFEYTKTALVRKDIENKPVLIEFQDSDLTKRRSAVDSFCKRFDVFRGGGYSRHFVEAHRQEITRMSGEPHFESRLIEWVIIPGGTYFVRPEKSSREKIPVSVCSFAIQRFPVTNAQFASFLKESQRWEPDIVRGRDDNPYYLYDWPSGDTSLRDDPAWRNAPVVYVSWYAARDFAHSQGLRLPTEVEWEVAARIFHQRTDLEYQWTEDVRDSLADWIEARGESERLKDALPDFPVFEDPTAFRDWMTRTGADVPSHMAGGVKEWVIDEYAKTYPYPLGAGLMDGDFGQGSLIDPYNDHFHWEDGDQNARRGWKAALAGKRLKVLRGGSFQVPFHDAKIGRREQQSPTNCNPDAGFRCVLPIRGKCA